jgi:hypothetical protein
MSEPDVGNKGAEKRTIITSDGSERTFYVRHNAPEVMQGNSPGPLVQQKVEKKASK